METDLANITHVVLSGGGLSGFAYLGVLAHLQDAAPKLQHVAGTSIGAFFAFLLSIGADMKAVRDYIITLLRDNPDVLDIPVDSLFRFTEQKGFLPLDALLRILEHFSKLHIGTPNPTFEQLTVSGPRLTITATELHSGTCHYFSVDNSPHVPVLDVVRASMSIPFISPPVSIQECPGCLYVDGFLTDNYPVAAFADEEVPCSLGVSIVPPPPEPRTDPSASTSFPDYAFLVLQTVCGAFLNFKKYRRVVDRYLPITDPPIPALPVDLISLSIQITPEQIQKSFDYGLSLWLR